MAGVFSWGLGHAQAPNNSPGTPPGIPGQNPNGIQIYPRSGLKTHGPGQHDYPQFLADWSKLLTQHGAWAGKHPVDELVDDQPPPAGAPPVKH